MESNTAMQWQQRHDDKKDPDSSPKKLLKLSSLVTENSKPSSSFDHTDTDTHNKALNLEAGIFGTSSGFVPILKLCSSSSNPEEATFAIDHLTELIFRFLEKKALLSCRLVSKRMKHFASKELEKILTIRFKPEDEGRNGEKECFETYITKLVDDPSDRHTYRVRPLDSFVTLLKNTPDFPCSSFLFTDPDSILPVARYFFETVGSRVKKLELADEFMSPAYFHSLKKILTSLALNLEHLVLNCKVNFGMSLAAKGECDYDDYMLFLLDEFKNTLYSSNDAATKAKFQLRLKILEVRKMLPESILREILEASPYLREVNVTVYEHLHLLVQPKNRLYLLQKFDIRINKENIETLEILAIHLEGNCNLKKLRLFDASFRIHQKKLIPRATDVLNKFFKASENSLRELTWGQLSILKGLHFPVFKNVKTLELLISSSECIRGVTAQFFPLKVCIGDVFPNVKFVNIPNTILNVPLTDLFYDFKPIKCVVKVCVSVRLGQLEQFQEMFPNAICTTCY